MSVRGTVCLNYVLFPLPSTCGLLWLFIYYFMSCSVWKNNCTWLSWNVVSHKRLLRQPAPYQDYEIRIQPDTLLHEARHPHASACVCVEQQGQSGTKRLAADWAERKGLTSILGSQLTAQHRLLLLKNIRISRSATKRQLNYWLALKCSRPDLILRMWLGTCDVIK